MFSIPFLVLILLASPQQHLSESEWLDKLGVERYRVMRQKGTERAYSGKYFAETREGVYRCAGCDVALFLSEAKYVEPNNGWPAFKEPIDRKKVYYIEDWNLSFKRYEVLCRGCDGHLGHIFHDGPPPKYLRYTINSLALRFEPLPQNN